jgi:Fe-Mn family superoxide dismutase
MPDTRAPTSGILTYPFKLPALPYAQDALAPAISAQTMGLHYGKHHQSYVDNLNAALKDYPDLQRLSLHELLVSPMALPDLIQETVRNNGGGHANHSMYWSVMAAPDDKRAPSGDLASALSTSFGDLDTLKNDFNEAGKKLFGSGWVFVVTDPSGRLVLKTSPNQDTPLMNGRAVLFGNDVWEHAYYLTYQNRRADYLKDWWRILNWDAIGARYTRIVKGDVII